MAYISFWRFGKEEQWEREKEIFLDELRLLVSCITKNKEKKELYTKANETELAKTIKQIIAKKIMMILILMIQSLFLCFFWDYLIKFLQKVKKKKYLKWNLLMTIGKVNQRYYIIIIWWNVEKIVHKK